MDNFFLRQKWENIQKIHSEKNKGVDVLIFARDKVEFIFFVTSDSTLGIKIAIQGKTPINENILPKAKNWKILNNNITENNKSSSVEMLLANKEFEEPFKETVSSLILKIYNTKLTGKECLINFLKNLERIKSFFDDDTYPKRLSDEEQTGLFGELVVLKEFFFLKKGVEDALNCWTGPSKKHDFTLANTLIEVKTTISPEKYIVNASSKNQLDPNQPKALYLVFQRLKKKPSGKTLPEYIEEIKEKISEISDDLLKDFTIKLMQSKYFETQSKYYSHKYTKQEQLFFHVKDNFPTIETSSTDAILNIKYSYQVDLNKCLNYKVNSEQFNKIFV